MNLGDFATLPHPFKDSGNKAQTGRGEGPPSRGSGGLPRSAVHLAVGPPRLRRKDHLAVGDLAVCHQ